MSLTEREKEIALECESKILEGLGCVERYDLFLSRIREEQEPFGYFVGDSVEIVKVATHEDDAFPLFTIPPAAPDCKELVEALARISLASQRTDSPSHVILREVGRIAREIVAKHKASMGEE